MENILQNFIERKAKYLYNGHQKYQSDRYKRNTITKDLHRAGNIASNMIEEIQTIRKKFIKDDYPRPFFNSVINQYNNKTKEQQIDNEDDYFIPPYLFEEEKPLILLKLPFCEQNEAKSKDFIKKFHKFANNNLRVAISWKTRKLKTLFKIKDKNLYPACKIYYGECEHYGDNYIGETVRNTVTLWSQHNNLNHNSEPAEHIKRNIDHVFHRKILCLAPSQKRLRKNLEPFLIALFKPSLKDQKSFDRPMLFKKNIIDTFM